MGGTAALSCLEKSSYHKITKLVKSVDNLPSFIYVFFFFFCSEFCHTLKWKGLGFTCLPHPDPPSHLPSHPLPPGPPRAPGPSACSSMFYSKDPALTPNKSVLQWNQLEWEKPSKSKWVIGNWSSWKYLQRQRVSTKSSIRTQISKRPQWVLTRTGERSLICAKKHLDPDAHRRWLVDKWIWLETEAIRGHSECGKRLIFPFIPSQYSEVYISLELKNSRHVILKKPINVTQTLFLRTKILFLFSFLFKCFLYWKKFKSTEKLKGQCNSHLWVILTGFINCQYFATFAFFSFFHIYANINI